MKIYFAAATSYSINRVIMVKENDKIAQRTDPDRDHDPPDHV